MLAALAQARWVAESASLELDIHQGALFSPRRQRRGERVGRGPLSRWPNCESPPRRRRPWSTRGNPSHARNASDASTALDVIEAVPGHMKRLIADRGSDADALRRNSGPPIQLPSSRVVEPVSCRSGATGPTTRIAGASGSLLSPEGLPVHRNALRQTCRQLCFSRRPSPASSHSGADQVLDPRHSYILTS